MPRLTDVRFDWISLTAVTAVALVTALLVGLRPLRGAWIVAGVGGAGGLLAAWPFGRVLQGWLFGVSPHDPAVHQ
jgi:hypothetical protein